MKGTGRQLDERNRKGGNLCIRDRELQKEKGKLEQEIQEYSGKQRNLEKIVEGLSKKIQKMEMQPISGKGFSTSSTQNLSGSFGNLTTSFQVKVDLILVSLVGQNQSQTVNDIRSVED